MRRLWLFWLASCSYTAGQTSGSASTPPDAPVGQASPDAPPDASTACLAHATKTLAGHHYFATGSQQSWTNSQATCASFGGHLVKIRSMAENDLVTSLAGGGFTWIGLHDPSSTYMWTDATPLTGYNAFPNQTPPAMPDSCVDSDGNWSAFDCTYNGHGGVCECE